MDRDEFNKEQTGITPSEELFNPPVASIKDEIIRFSCHNAPSFIRSESHSRRGRQKTTTRRGRAIHYWVDLIGKDRGWKGSTSPSNPTSKAPRRDRDDEEDDPTLDHLDWHRQTRELECLNCDFRAHTGRRRGGWRWMMLCLFIFRSYLFEKCLNTQYTL